jgi:NTE family protein
MSERLLVVGGGGARGAWGGGFAHCLRRRYGQPYRFVFGTSTGSLLAPLIVLDDFATLKEAYTSITQSSVFNVNPFDKKGNLNGLNAAWRLLTHKDSFGESDNLLTLIRQFLTPDRYQQITNKNPSVQFTVCCVNFKDGQVVYRNSGPEMKYEDICRWIWASANEPIFMSFVELPGGFYVDGGVRANVPVVETLSYAMKLGISEIDIIVNKPIDPIVNKSFKPDGILKDLLRLIELWETEVRNSNIMIAKLLARLGETEPPPIGPGKEMPSEPAINLHFHYIPGDLFSQYQNELIVDKQKMLEFWQKGERCLEDGANQKNFTILHKHAARYVENIK